MLPWSPAAVVAVAAVEAPEAENQLDQLDEVEEVAMESNMEDGIDRLVPMMSPPLLNHSVFT